MGKEQGQGGPRTDVSRAGRTWCSSVETAAATGPTTAAGRARAGLEAAALQADRLPRGQVVGRENAPKFVDFARGRVQCAKF